MEPLFIEPYENGINLLDHERTFMMQLDTRELYMKEDINGTVLPAAILQYGNHPFATRDGAYQLARYIYEKKPRLKVDWLQTFIIVDTIWFFKIMLGVLKPFHVELLNVDSLPNLSWSQSEYDVVLKYDILDVLNEQAAHTAIETLRSMGFIIKTYK